MDSIIFFSEILSSELVASSSRRIWGFLRMILAIATLCL